VTLERFCVKFPAQAEVSVDEATFIPIFHEWIRDRILAGTLLDVVDYRHVPDGPGIMLITHEINYAMDHDQGEFGLYAQRKLGPGASHQERLVHLLRQTVAFGARLEADRRIAGGLKLQGGKFYYLANDRLRAPNTDESFAALKPDLEAAAASLYPGQSVSVSRLQSDPRQRLTLLVDTHHAVDMATLAA